MILMISVELDDTDASPLYEPRAANPSDRKVGQAKKAK
jgi:hypothetical protein